MSYIGREPQIGNFQVCDAISVVNGQAAYTMQVDSTNVVPESANHVLCSLNGILQKSGSSFTISGSTITFASNLVTGDVIDFIHILGSTLDLGVPSDATVTNAKTNFVSTSSAAGLQIKGDGTTDGTLQLNCSQNSHGVKIKSPAHSASQSYTLTLPATAPATDKILQTDSSGNLSFVDQSGGGLIYINSFTPSGSASTISLTNIFSSTYRNYRIVCAGLCIATNNSDMKYRFLTGTDTDHSSGYYWSIGTSNRNGTSVNESSDNDSSGRFLSNTSTDDDTISGEFVVYNPNQAVKTTITHAFIDRFQGSATAHPQYGGCWVNASDQFTGIRLFGSYNWTAKGKIIVYGMVDS